MKSLWILLRNHLVLFLVTPHSLHWHTHLQDNLAIYNLGHLVQSSFETIVTSQRSCLDKDLEKSDMKKRLQPLLVHENWKESISSSGLWNTHWWLSLPRVTSCSPLHSQQKEQNTPQPTWNVCMSHFFSSKEKLLLVSKTCILVTSLLPNTKENKGQKCEDF